MAAYACAFKTSRNPTPQHIKSANNCALSGSGLYEHKWVRKYERQGLYGLLKPRVIISPDAQRAANKQTCATFIPQRSLETFPGLARGFDIDQEIVHV
jgi:hypothetical protein